MERGFEKVVAVVAVVAVDEDSVRTVLGSAVFGGRGVQRQPNLSPSHPIDQCVLWATVVVENHLCCKLYPVVDHSEVLPTLDGL